MRAALLVVALLAACSAAGVADGPLSCWVDERAYPPVMHGVWSHSAAQVIEQQKNLDVSTRTSRGFEYRWPHRWRAAVIEPLIMRVACREALETGVAFLTDERC